MNAQEAALAISNLRKQGRWERAIEEGRVAIKQWPTDRGLRLAIAWCLWKRVTEALKQDLDDHIWLSVRRDLKVVSEWANEAAGPSGYDRYDPLPLLVGTVMRAAKKENKPSRVVEASAFAEPNRLPDTPSKDFASHRMQWFSYLSWAYEESGNWSEIGRAHV